MTELLNKTLMKLKIKYKLLIITEDNTFNNETLVSELFFHLTEKFPIAIQSNIQSDIKYLHFQDIDSYVCCLAHILNLIVQDILAVLKADNHKTAVAACDFIQKSKEMNVTAHAIGCRWRRSRQTLPSTL